jgi:CBS domain-containing protein
MRERKIGCLPVVENGQLAGLLGEADCLGYLEHVLEIADAKGLLPELSSGG